jgi:phage FluMu gp28-like protein
MLLAFTLAMGLTLNPGGMAETVNPAVYAPAIPGLQPLQLEVSEPMPMRSGIDILPTYRRFIEDDHPFCWMVASVQSGKSFAASLKHVFRRLQRPGLSIFLSASDRQSKELIVDKVARHIRAMGIAGARFGSGFFEKTSIAQHEVLFPNGSRIISLAANPDTARGYSGDVLLDEFAMHRDSKAIWAAMMGRITRGYSVDVMSTFKGTNNQFYELGEALGLHQGMDPGDIPVKTYDNGEEVWHGYWLSMDRALREGLNINFARLRAAINDEMIVGQEYLCIPMKGGDEYISLDLVKQCETGEALGLPFDAFLSWCAVNRDRRRLFAGWDIARIRDFSVIWIFELVDQMVIDLGLDENGRRLTVVRPRLMSRGLIEMHNMPFPQQAAIGRQIAALVERFALDATGHRDTAETLATQFPGVVEQVIFDLLVKEQLASGGKDAMERNLLLLPPDNRTIRASFTSLKRYQSSGKVMRVDAPHSKSFGHADHAWAAWLAYSAATGHSSYVPASWGGVIGETVMGDLAREFAARPSYTGMAA